MRWLTDALPFLGGGDGPELAGNGLVLRPPMMADFAVWVALREASRDFLIPWEPTWPADDLTRGAFRRKLAQAQLDARDESGFSFLIFKAEGLELIGGITLSNIRRRAAQTATLGYWMGERHAGKGHMTRAVRLLADFSFRELGLDRVEAACLPENLASVRVLEKAGFRREGYARGYLAIAGRRRDHLLYGLLKADFFPPDSHQS
jgi:[ribosomal protein S5]-alanine N-acetyltransferase